MAQEREVEQRTGRGPGMAQVGEARRHPERQRSVAPARGQGRQADERQAEHQPPERGGGQAEPRQVDGPVGRGGLSGRKRVTSTIPAAPIGTLIQKIQCQLR